MVITFGFVWSVYALTLRFSSPLWGTFLFVSFTLFATQPVFILMCVYTTMSSLRPLMSLCAFSLVKGAHCSVQHPTVCIYFKGSWGEDTSLDSKRHVGCSNSTAMTCVYPCTTCVRKWVGVWTRGAQTLWHIMRNEHTFLQVQGSGVQHHKLVTQWCAWDQKKLSLMSSPERLI